MISTYPPIELVCILALAIVQSWGMESIPWNVGTVADSVGAVSKGGGAASASPVTEQAMPASKGPSFSAAGSKQPGTSQSKSRTEQSKEEAEYQKVLGLIKLKRPTTDAVRLFLIVIFAGAFGSWPPGPPPSGGPGCPGRTAGRGWLQPPHHWRPRASRWIGLRTCCAAENRFRHHRHCRLRA